MLAPDFPHLRNAGAIAGRLLEATGAEELRIIRDDYQHRAFFTLEHSHRAPVTLAVAYETPSGDEAATLTAHLLESLPFGIGWR